MLSDLHVVLNWSCEGTVRNNILEQQKQMYKILSVFEWMLYVSNNLIYQNFVCCCGLHSQRSFSFKYLHESSSSTVWDVWGELIQLFHIWAAINIYLYWYKKPTDFLPYIAACVKKRHDNYSQHRYLTLCFELAHYIARFTGWRLDIKPESDWRKQDKYVYSPLRYVKWTLNWLVWMFFRKISRDFHIKNSSKI